MEPAPLVPKVTLPSGPWNPWLRLFPFDMQSETKAADFCLQRLKEAWRSSVIGPFITHFEFNKGILAGCPAARLFNESKEHERTIYGFHGTSPEAAQAICHEGFDPHRRKLQTYGPGEYLAVLPRDAASYSGGKGAMVFVLCVYDVRGYAVSQVVGSNVSDIFKTISFVVVLVVVVLLEIFVGDI